MGFAALSQQFQCYLCGEHRFSADQAAEVPWRRLAFLAYAFVIFFVGLPVWWVTTTPHRAPLPRFDADIQQQVALLHAQAEQQHDAVVGGKGEAAAGDDDDAAVWHFLRAQSDYSLHLIWVHDHNNNVEAQQQAVRFALRVQRKLEQFAHKHLRPAGIRVLIGSEHLWDFSLADYLLLNNHQQQQQQQSFNKTKIVEISSSDPRLPASLCSELDALVGSAPLSSKPLLKLAVFLQHGDDQHQQIRLTHDGMAAQGLAIASWGGLFIAQHPTSNADDEHRLLNAIASVLQRQLAIKPLSAGAGGGGTDVALTLAHHKRRLAIENLAQTVQILNSLHELADQISDLVIPEEVARLADRSKALFLTAFQSFAVGGNQQQIDSESAAEARRLATRANTDPRLLELLNFPADQKYGIYVPLFLPLLVPMLQPAALCASFLLLKLKQFWMLKKNGQSAEEEEEDKAAEEEAVVDEEKMD